MPKQASSSIMMVRPKHFGFDPITAASNAFQDETGADATQAISAAAIAEFDAAVKNLRSSGINVHVIEDTDTPIKPNAVFPNNWISFHDGTVILYPMLAENRRWERRDEILVQLKSEGLKIDEVIDISKSEREAKYLESTGSMVLDYVHMHAYACISDRTDRDVLKRFCEVSGFEAIIFEAFDKGGLAVYHTNVLMCIGTKYVVICLEAIPKDQRMGVVAALEQSGHEVVPITMDQMYSFAGNMLEVLDDQGNSVLVMSAAAMKSLDTEQKNGLSQHATLLSIEIPTIEKFGGGSVRCMMCRLT